MVSAGSVSAQAVPVTSIENVAQLHLSDRIGRILAKSAASTAVKAGVAAGVGNLTKNGDLGALTFWLLAHANQPDLRSWMSLPAELRVARLRLPAGSHQVRLEAGGKTLEQAVEIKPRRITLLVGRVY